MKETRHETTRAAHTAVSNRGSTSILTCLWYGLATPDRNSRRRCKVKQRPPAPAGRVTCPRCRSRLEVFDSQSGARTVSVVGLGLAVESKAKALERFLPRRRSRHHLPRVRREIRSRVPVSRRATAIRSRAVLTHSFFCSTASGAARVRHRCAPWLRLRRTIEATASGWGRLHRVRSVVGAVLRTELAKMVVHVEVGPAEPGRLGHPAEDRMQLPVGSRSGVVISSSSASSCATSAAKSPGLVPPTS